MKQPCAKVHCERHCNLQSRKLLQGNEGKFSREDQLGLLSVWASSLHLFFIRALTLSCKKNINHASTPFLLCDMGSLVTDSRRTSFLGS